MLNFLVMAGGIPVRWTGHRTQAFRYAELVTIAEITAVGNALGIPGNADAGVYVVEMQNGFPVSAIQVPRVWSSQTSNMN